MNHAAPVLGLVEGQRFIMVELTAVVAFLAVVLAVITLVACG